MAVWHTTPLPTGESGGEQSIKEAIQDRTDHHNQYRDVLDVCSGSQVYAISRSREEGKRSQIGAYEARTVISDRQVEVTLRG